MKQFEAF